MPTGAVKWFNSEKGFGFIVPDDPGNDIFVHISSVKAAGWEGLDEGQRLEFELREGRNGRVSADDLRPADGAAPAASTGGGGAAAAGGAVPLLMVEDVSATIAYYRHVLGFDEVNSMEHDGVVQWAEVAYNGARLWLVPSEDGGDLGMSGMLYFMVDDVEARADDVAGRAEVLYGPEEKPYGFKELAVRDVNGYTLVFAEETGA